MATERQANKARDLHADFLVRHGAHAISVEPGDAHGKSGFVVVAHVAAAGKHSIPRTLSGKLAGKTFEVPVIARETEKFRPE